MLRDHQELCDDLASSVRELALLEAHELWQRTNAWNQSDERSATGREQYSRYLTVDTSSEVIKLKGEIRGLEYELRAVEWAATHDRTAV